MSRMFENSESSEQFLKQNAFLTESFSDVIHLEHLEFKKYSGFRNLQEKLEKGFFCIFLNV